MLLSVMVVANVYIANAHVAEAGTIVAGLPTDPLYLATRPFFQPFILLWALVASEAIMPRTRASRAAAEPQMEDRS